MARLLLIRHAEAVDSDEWTSGDDRSRPLSARGRKQVQRLARRLRKQGLSEAPLLTSPWTRALETATLLRRALGFEQEPRPVDRLAGDAPVEDALEALHEALSGNDLVVMVGHEPILSRLVSRLTVGTEGTLEVRLRKAAWCLLEVDGNLRTGGARILELRNPSPLRTPSEGKGSEPAVQAETGKALSGPDEPSSPPPQESVRSRHRGARLRRGSRRAE